VEVRLFGDVQVRAAGRVLDMGTPRQQAVLAALVVDAGRPVALDALVDRIWDDAPPAAARSVLYAHLSRIRTVLRSAEELSGGRWARLERRHAGYVLDLAPDRVDVTRFLRLVDQGLDRGHPASSQVAALTRALQLWRATPMAALRGPWFAQVRERWRQRRLDALLHWAATSLRLGHPGQVIAVLHALVGEYPLVEPIHELLMRALHGSGRGCEAVEHYARVRRTLAAELGVDPGERLGALHRALLRGGPLPPPLPLGAPTGAGGRLPQ
jgi:DNA-binding SARP family transcriptional activator